MHPVAALKKIRGETLRSKFLDAVTFKLKLLVHPVAALKLLVRRLELRRAASAQRRSVYVGLHLNFFNHLN